VSAAVPAIRSLDDVLGEIHATAHALRAAAPDTPQLARALEDPDGGADVLTRDGARCLHGYLDPDFAGQHRELGAYRRAIFCGASALLLVASHNDAVRRSAEHHDVDVLHAALALLPDDLRLQHAPETGQAAAADLARCTAELAEHRLNGLEDAQLAVVVGELAIDVLVAAAQLARIAPAPQERA
jgi:hypothetical protein